MKILLIGFTKLAFMPYMHFYLEQLVKEGNTVHVLYWNRDEKEENPLAYDVILHEVRLYQNDEIVKIRKISNFARYRKQAKRLLTEGRFDLVIVLHTIPAILISDVLYKYYTKKYILDYRDETFEKIGIYKRVIHKLVKNSAATFVSSAAFRRLLPDEDNIYTSHNILLDSLKNREVRRNSSRKNKPIRIRFWGFIRHEMINKVIIDRIANDERFELHYHGRVLATAINLEKYCIKRGIGNVYFHGEYTPEERYEFAKETDLIHNIYENDSQTSNAMGNKFYDGVVFYIPQLCSLGSFMGGQITDAEVGLACSPNSMSFADDVFLYYNSISWNDFENKCDDRLDMILREYQEGVRIIKDIAAPGGEIFEGR